MIAYEHMNWVKIFWILVIMTVLTVIGMQISGEPLKTEAAPGGIISFEFAGTLESSQEIINSWQGETMLWVGINMGMDFLFLTLYSITIALGCLLISQLFGEKNAVQSKLGIWLAGGVLLAALLDIIENIALIKLLLGSQNNFLPLLAKWMAIPKFLLVIGALIYVAQGAYPAIKQNRQ